MVATWNGEGKPREFVHLNGTETLKTIVGSLSSCRFSKGISSADPSRSCKSVQSLVVESNQPILKKYVRQIWIISNPKDRDTSVKKSDCLWVATHLSNCRRSFVES